jgi:hypothetical protein
MSSVMCISVEKMGVESIHFVAWSVGPEIVTVCMAKKLGTRNANDGARTCQISPDGFGFCVASESGIMPFYDDAVIPNYACSASCCGFRSSEEHFEGGGGVDGMDWVRVWPGVGCDAEHPELHVD